MFFDYDRTDHMHTTIYIKSKYYIKIDMLRTE